MKNYKISLFLSVLLLALTACDKEKNITLSFDDAKKNYPQVIKLSDFGAIPNDSKDDALAIRNAIKSAKELSEKGGVRIVMEKGKYDLLTYEHGVAILFANLKNIMLDGNGAILIRHKQRTNIEITNSENITIANISFENAELPFALAKVTKKNKDSFDCQVYPKYKVVETHPKAVIGYDSKRDYIDMHVCDIYQLQTRLKIKKLSENSMRVPLEKYAQKRIPAVNEDVIVRYEVYGPAAISMNKSKNISVYNSNIYAHSGMGIHGFDTENILIDNLNVRARTHGICMSATADATHFNYCRGKIQIINSYFEKMGDDATNVHQMYWMLTARKSPTEFTVKWGKKGVTWIPSAYLPKLNDLISFGDADDCLRLGFSAKVLGVKIDKESKTADITIDASLPDFVKEGWPMANLSSDPKLEIRNCTVRGNRARGFLIKVSEALVENCSFEHTTSPAILFENDANYWYEGFRTKNVKIRNCKFKTCNEPHKSQKGKINKPVIYDNAWVNKNLPLSKTINDTTTVENCIFEDCGKEPIQLIRTKNPISKNNKITE